MALLIDIRQTVIARLKEERFENPALEGDIILASILEKDRYTLAAEGDIKLTDEQVRKVEKALVRRLNHEPMAYITGVKEFYSLDFIVTPDVLIPRPETELLVDLTLYYTPRSGRVCDLGTGSGAIAVALKHNRPDCVVSASDISAKALTVARKNAARVVGRKGIIFKRGDLFGPFEGQTFDIIVSNPPYVAREEAPSLQKELSCEPEIALFAEHGGRDIIEKIINGADEYLAARGVLLLEIGARMRDFILDEGAKGGYSVSVMNDYAGLPRAAILKKG